MRRIQYEICKSKRLAALVAGLVIAGAIGTATAEPVDELPASWDPVVESLAADPRDPTRVASFMEAARGGDRGRVHGYVLAGIDIDARDTEHELRYTALGAAILEGENQTAHQLLTAGADPNLAHSDGNTPLILAIRLDAPRWLIDALLEAGADPNFGNPNGITPLGLAIRDGAPEWLINALLENGADVNARDDNGGTPLMEAVLKGDERSARALLDQGARLDDQLLDGDMTALHFAVLTVADPENLPVALLLLERGADPDIPDDEGRTPLMEAVEHGWSSVLQTPSDGYPELIEALVAAGADVDLQDEAGLTALSQAAANGDVDTMTLLLDHGADPGVRHADGTTPVDTAIAHREGRALRLLIDRGAPLTLAEQVKYYFGRAAYGLAWVFTPLLFAVFAILFFYVRRRASKPPRKTSSGPGGTDELPRLAPLTCASCGGGLPLALSEVRCPYCRAPAAPPEDYVATLKARAQAAADVRKAARAWRRAGLFTALPVIVFVWTIGFAWLTITVAGLYNDFGRAVFSGSGLLTASALIAALGLPLFSLVYGLYLQDVRKRLPVIPDVGKKVSEAEISNCRTCSAPIAYEAGELVTTCSYCGGEMVRVALARRARAKATEEKEEASLSLYQAMEEVAERREMLLETLIAVPFVLPALLLLGPVGFVIVGALFMAAEGC